MGKHVAPRKRPRLAPWLTGPAIFAAVLAPASGTGAAPGGFPQGAPGEPAAITAPLAVLTYERPQVTTIPAPVPPRHAGMSFQAFLDKYEGQRPILPGYSTPECMAIFSFYNYDVVLGDPYSAPGAQDVWLSNIWTAYNRIPAGQPAQRGDVVLWSGSYGAYTGGGYGHVAIVIEDHGSTLLAFGQNPNPATNLELSKSGVLGYLRPKHLNP